MTWKQVRRWMEHPLFYSAIAVYFIALAWYQDAVWIGWTAGVLSAMAIGEWTDWYYDRWKERYHRERSS